MNERLMKKIARPSYWDKIEGGLRKITNLPGPVHAVLGNRDKLKFHQALPQGVDPKAKAYVTTEDTNDDGSIETINIVVTNLEKEWPQDILSKINQMDESDPVFQDILNGIAKTLIHELAHIDDHKDGSFPGGEGIAESRENAFTPNFGAASITNVSNKVISPLELSKNGDIKMKKEIIKLANHLDNLGHSDLADRLDVILKSADVDLIDDDDILPSKPGATGVEVGGHTSITGESVGGQSMPDDLQFTEDTTDSEVSDDDADTAQANAENILNQIQEGKAASVSNSIDAMAKLISKEFSLTSGGNVHRD
jgi:hypothetical protein